MAVQNLKSFKFKIYNLGFTLIELIVVMAIVSSIAALVLAHYRSGEQVSDLQTYSQKIANVLKQAQSLALSGEEIAGGRPNGYGVYFPDASTYILFADTNGNNNWNSTDSTIQSFTLPERLIIDTISGSLPASFLFRAPFAEFYLNGSRDTSNNTIVIKHTQLNRTLTIYLNGTSGQIDVR